MQFFSFSKGCWSKLPVNLIAAWTFFLLFIYLFLIKQTTRMVVSGPRSVPHMLDAVVYIAMSKMTSDPMVDYSIASLRKLGQWNGRVYIITDNPQCFESTIQKYDVKLVKVPPVNSLIEIKAMKTRLFDYLPSSTIGILYIDVDIVIRQSLELFYKDLSDLVSYSLPSKPIHGNTSMMIPISTNTNVTITHFDFAAFPDAKGHYIGFCSGCEKWHTGIMYMRRNYGQSCLKGWGEILLSGKFDTDQESLDEAERSGYCPNAVMLPPRHLLFAKDYIAMMLSSGQTFIHFTSAARLETQDYFYRSIVVPNLRSSLNPPLKPSILKEKVCHSISSSDGNSSSSG